MNGIYPCKMVRIASDTMEGYISVSHPHHPHHQNGLFSVPATIWGLVSAE